MKSKKMFSFIFILYNKSNYLIQINDVINDPKILKIASQQLKFEEKQQNTFEIRQKSNKYF